MYCRYIIHEGGIPDVLRVIEQMHDYCKALADTDRQTG